MTGTEKAKLVGRWIAFGPVAALAAFVTPFTVKLINRLGLFWVGLDPDWLLSRAYIEALAGLGMGAVFVYVGARVAPNHKRNATVTLAGVALVLTGGALFADLLVADYWAVWQGAFFAVGACAVSYSIVKGEITIESASLPRGSAQ
jgi:hypothetical protein